LSQATLDPEKELKSLELEIRELQDKLWSARTHLQSASTNWVNSRGRTMISENTGRTRDSNKIRAAQLEKVYVDAKAHCKDIEDELALKTKRRVELKTSLGLPY